MKFRTSDGVSLHYTDTGIEDKPVIVGIPGIGGTIQMWQKLIELFGDEFRFIMLDPRNQGESQRTFQGQRIARHAADLAELFNKLELHNVISIGNSMGAANFWAYLGQYGQGRLSCMIDLDQPPKMISDDSWNYGFKDLNWDNYPEYLKFDFGKATYAHIDDQMFNNAKAEYQKFPYDPAENYLCLVDHAQQDWRDIILTMPVPMLVIAGKNSPYFDYHFTEAIKNINDQIETEVIDDCGHLIQAEQPEKAHEIIMEFLKKHKII